MRSALRSPTIYCTMSGQPVRLHTDLDDVRAALLSKQSVSQRELHKTAWGILLPRSTTVLVQITVMTVIEGTCESFPALRSSARFFISPGLSCANLCVAVQTVHLLYHTQSQPGKTWFIGARPPCLICLLVSGLMSCCSICYMTHSTSCMSTFSGSCCRHA